MSDINDIQKLATIFETSLMLKQSFVKKMPNGKWKVVSRKGKSLGVYNTKEEAKKRLRQIEFFKHKKASKEDNHDSYSSIMRDLKQHYDDAMVKEFQDTFKQSFDRYLLDNKQEPEVLALQDAIKAIDYEEDRIKKAAEAISLGDPKSVGSYLAHLVKFVMRRISPINRDKSIQRMKRKIYYLNEYDMAKKKLPGGAAYATVITLLKHLLMNHNPIYIRSVLNSTVGNI